MGKNAVPHLPDVLRREYDEMLKRLPFKARVEKHILEIEEMIARDLQGL
jgi:hypothetical protein